MELLILLAIAVATVPAMLFQTIANASVRWVLFGFLMAGALGYLIAMPVIENGDLVVGTTEISGIQVVPVGIGALLILNFVVLPFIYWIDKIHKNTNAVVRSQKNQTSRVPESAMHTLTAMGGAVGAFASQQLFRHKRSKGAFQVIFFLTILTSMLVYYGLWLALEPDMAKVDAWIDKLALFENVNLFGGK